MKQIGKLTAALLINALLIVMLWAAGSSPALADNHGQTLLSGGSWMNGRGVDVKSNGTRTGSGYDWGASYCKRPDGANVYCGQQWQCVELPQRLYISRGWYPSAFPVGAAYQIYDKAAAGAIKNCAAYRNGSGYIPIPGDLIISSIGAYGHVSVVDTVDTAHNVVNAVEQNVSSTNARAAYKLLGSTLSRAGFPIKGVVHCTLNSYIAPQKPAPQIFNGAIPQVHLNAGGRISVLMLGADRAIWHIKQIAPNSAWSKWEKLGGILNSDPVIGQNADGRLEFFVVGTNGHLFSKWQVAPDGPWTTSGGTDNSGWQDYGCAGGGIIGNPAVGINADHRLQVYVRGCDGAIYTIWQQSQNGNWSGWLRFSNGGYLHDPAVGVHNNGHQEVFALGGNYAVYSRYQSQLNGSWDSWGCHGGNVNGKPVVSQSYHGFLDFFIRGKDGITYFKRYNENTHNWTNWAAWGIAFSVASNPAVVVNQSGLKQVFVRGWDSSIYSFTENNHAWESLGGASNTDPAIGTEQDGRLHLFIHGLDGYIYHRYQRIMNNHIEWTSWEQLQ